MKLSRPGAIGISLVLALCVVLSIWYAGVGDTTTVTIEEPASAPAASAAMPLTSTSAPNQFSERLVSDQHVPLARLKAAVFSENPYAEAVRSRERGGPGGFAVAAYLQSMCQDAMGAIADSRDPERLAVMAEYVSKRPNPAHSQAQMALAAQRLEARCSQFQSNSDLDHPKSDDPDGLRFEHERVDLNDFQNFPFQAVKDYANQGVLVAVASSLRHWAYFDGVSRQSTEDRDMFGHAVMLAEFLSSSDPSNRSSDTRVLTGCLKTGFCDGSYESIVLRKWPIDSPQRQAAIELAERMATALQNNDVSRFTKR